MCQMTFFNKHLKYTHCANYGISDELTMPFNECRINFLQRNLFFKCNINTNIVNYDMWTVRDGS